MTEQSNSNFNNLGKVFSFENQLRKVIEWKNQDPNILLYKFPSENDEIKNASKLIVAPGQGCVLVYKGKIINIITEPNLYKLDTDNHPFFTSLFKILQDFESEHKLKIYFFRTAEVFNQYWGTASKIKYVDTFYDLPVSLGISGNFSYKIEQPEFLFSSVLGSKDTFSIQEMKIVISERMIDQIRSYIAVQKIPYNDIDSQLTSISHQVIQNSEQDLKSLGLILTDFNITETSFDDETIKRIGRISDMSIDINIAKKAGIDYTDLEKLRGMRDALKNEGGLAGLGAQMMMGLEIGKNFSNLKNETSNSQYSINKTQQEEAMVGEKEDSFIKLKKLKNLLDEQIITQEEFDQLKKRILENI